MSNLPLASDKRALVAVSLKMYLTAAETKRWVQDVRRIVEESKTAATEVAVLPSFPILESTAAILGGTSVRWGAQDIAPSAAGAQTGEVSATMLRELGCVYVELAHAERRSIFGEDDLMILNKLRQVLEVGLVPLYCVGEEEQGSPNDAVEHCLRELGPVFDLTRGYAPGLVVAYEPRWAIGADKPAPADHVRHVCTEIRKAAPDDNVRVIYGGSAGPGTFSDLQPAADGIFLGRFAHDVANLAAVLREVDDQRINRSRR